MRKIIVLLPVLLFTLCSLVSCGNDDEPQGGDESVTDAKFIDLGLPSGLLWADRNIGAPSPEDAGYYYAWGETEPNGSYSPEDYKFDNCTKYNTSDAKVTLEAKDDVATVKWGKTCRIPTVEEFKELERNCTWTWTSDNGGGYTVTGSNGNSIFLPATGLMMANGVGQQGTSLVNKGLVGYYWSSSLSDKDIQTAQSLQFVSGVIICGAPNVRYGGEAIRPVTRK